MMKKIILIFLLCLVPVNYSFAISLGDRLSGRILLQVEDNGEAWYINPEDRKRYFLGRPQDAFNIMRFFGVGISNKDLEKIPVANYSSNFAQENQEFIDKNKGKIFLQVESRGEAWYVNPEDGKRYFLGRPQDAFNIMRTLGLGIKNELLQNIEIGKISDSFLVLVSSEPGLEETATQTEPKESDELVYQGYNLSEIEKTIHDLINSKRIEHGLDELVWNSELTQVARKHSYYLAEQNRKITSKGERCDLPLIHHEGLDFGLYNFDRLKNENIHYFSQTGENIALVSTASAVFHSLNQETKDIFNNCKIDRYNLTTEFKSNLEQASSEQEKKQVIIEEIKKREIIFNNSESVKVEKKEIKDSAELCSTVVNGWMNSPPHRDNILQENYNQSGVGVYFVNDYIIATQVFIKKADCGYEQGPCCYKDGYHPYCFETLKCQEGTCVPNS